MTTRTRSSEEAGRAPFNGGQPRYLALAEILAQEIRQGLHPVGTLLPTEAMLCDRHHVSRHTVREAIRKLRELGLISRQQGVGTRVEKQEIAGRFVLSLGSIPSMWQYVEATRFVVKHKKIIDAAEAEMALPSIGNDEKWLMAEGTRILVANNVPVSYSVVYINGEFRGIAGQIGHKQVPIFGLAERRYGLKIVAIKQDISATVVPRHLCKMLDAEANAPALCIVRHYKTADDVLVEVSRSITPADRFTYVMDLHYEYPVVKR